MDTATLSQPGQLAVTERAFQRIAEIMKDEPGAIGLRVAVSGGGCSGFQYEFAMVAERQAEDIVLSGHGAAVLVDEMSLQYMAGSQIDFVDGLIGAKFEIRNPLATASCGCGTSFSI